jgi:hypothetical protein
MKTFFIRHKSKLDVDSNTIDNLWQNNLIGIHFPNIIKEKGTDLLNPENYENSSKNTLKRLIKIGKEGGYIFADYRGKDECKVGFVEPGTKVELFDAKWRGKNGKLGLETKLKVLQLSKFKCLSANDALAFKAAQPRQGTLCQWLKVNDRVKNIVENTISSSLGDLTPDLQEVMCMEFMRTDRATELGLPRLETTLMPVGRTMRDVDIYGLSVNAETVLAQVTFLSESAPGAIKKLEKLDWYVNSDNKTVLFCRLRPNQQSPLLIGRHIIFSLDLVFREFCESSDSGRRWFEAVTYQNTITKNLANTVSE